ncbi:hypothetical protein MWN34_18865 [Ancylobacter sp. 6x-1]|uniref:Uncharacterized protein n=1 Tax=Ancylobacter crimeensis TaxID=2579147 RepID=A0ABT0DGF5_9HYPH|nr:hypothetical protein [Ancylobacter crimeensis]MCK0198964.1 hypothetical protein [Ancylobacter crimeensis]
MATASRADDGAPPDGHSHIHSRPAPAAGVPSHSLLRLSVWQRLAIVVPVGVMLWGLALWVIWGGGS